MIMHYKNLEKDMETRYERKSLGQIVDATTATSVVGQAESSQLQPNIQRMAPYRDDLLGAFKVEPTQPNDPLVN